jgi:hypothetical protein
MQAYIRDSIKFRCVSQKMFRQMMICRASEISEPVADGRSFTASQDEICELVLADAGSDIHSSPEGSSVKSVVLRLPAKLRSIRCSE